MSMYPIASATLSAGQTSVDFNNIPQNFTHLQLRCFLRSTIALATHDLNIKTSLTTESATSQRLVGNGSTVSSAVGYAMPDTQALIGLVPGGNAIANAFGSVIIDIPDYSVATKNKTLVSICGLDLNGSGEIAIYSTSFLSTAAISYISIFVGGGGANMAVRSSFDLYGIHATAV